MPPKVELLPHSRDDKGVPQHYTYAYDDIRKEWVTGRLRVAEDELKAQLHEPTRLSHHSVYWLYRNRFVAVRSKGSPDEIVLRIKHVVLSDETEIDRLRRDVERFENLEKIAGTPREPIPDEVRMFVWQRDNGSCVKCGSKERLEFDHIIPLAKGGASTQRNIQLLCEKCNREKGVAI